MAEELFWKRFLKQTWEKQVAHLGTRVQPLATPEELFEVAVSIGEALANDRATLPVRWCDDGKKTRVLEHGADNARFLPSRKDGNFAGYEARMQSIDMFMLQMPALQILAPLLWPRLAAFAREILPHVGMVNHRSWSDAYVGRYRRTPFGIHLDGASNFTFGVVGSKAIYLWEPEFFEAKIKTAGTHDYEQFIGDAIALKVNAGETVYWPGRYYHIAAPDGLFSVTMNFAIYPLSEIETFIMPAMRTCMRERKTSARFTGIGPSPPMRQSIREIEKRVASGDLEKNIYRLTIEHCTRLAFMHPPPLRRKVRLRVGETVRIAEGCEIACVSRPDGFVLSANGYSLEVIRDCDLPRAVAALRRDKSLSVAAFAKLASGTKRQRGLSEVGARTVLEQLYRWSAVERVSQGRTQRAGAA